MSKRPQDLDFLFRMDSSQVSRRAVARRDPFFPMASRNECLSGCQLILAAQTSASLPTVSLQRTAGGRGTTFPQPLAEDDDPPRFVVFQSPTDCRRCSNSDSHRDSPYFIIEDITIIQLVCFKKENVCMVRGAAHLQAPSYQCSSEGEDIPSSD